MNDFATRVHDEAIRRAAHFTDNAGLRNLSVCEFKAGAAFALSLCAQELPGGESPEDDIEYARRRAG